VVGVRRACAVVCLVALGLAGCGGESSAAVTAALRRGQMEQALTAYDRAAADPGALRAIALAVVEREAWSRDRNRSTHAVAALQRAGSAAAPALRRIAAATRDPVLRARAQAALGRLGDDAARDALRTQLSAQDPDVQAVAVEVLDPVAEAPALCRLAQAPASAPRLAAVNALRSAPASPETLLVLTRAARLDPELAVRLAALRALPAQGPAGVDAIEARLADPEQAVRLLAIGMLVQADYARAERRLSSYLATDASPEGIESARMLLGNPLRAPESAIAQLERALAARDNALRAAAAVALMSTRDQRVLPLAQAHAAHEPARSVRLCLALALSGTVQALRGGDSSAALHSEGRELLAALMAGQDVVGSQAAAELARRGDARAVQRLQVLLHSHDATVRRVVVDALGGDLRRPRDVRSSLLDPDAAVRLSAASAILAA
jgi:HEAT repeat protein